MDDKQTTNKIVDGIISNFKGLHDDLLKHESDISDLKKNGYK